jgi:uncharacterized protein YfkK (UPF0435 family)
MSKVLILGATGSGKSTSIGNIPELNIEGLNPKETFIIGCSSKGLPFKGWMKNYPREKVKLNAQGIIIDIAGQGNYYMTNVGENVAQLITLINTKRQDINNIVIDDLNYTMQDYYMGNALKGGYDVFKKIGLFMGAIFNAIEKVQDKNVFVMAHYEEYKAKNNDTLSFRFKTVGNMVQNYSTPEGKFEIVLFTTQSFDEESKTIAKHFVTNYDGEFPAKSPIGMFEETYIPNDLGYVLKRIKEYNEG